MKTNKKKAKKVLDARKEGDKLYSLVKWKDKREEYFDTIEMINAYYKRIEKITNYKKYKEKREEISKPIEKVKRGKGK
jgi:hypothetical protein